MSDFKRKIEIVESTTPPPNKYNWWFDLNARKLKRFDGGEWVEYTFKPKIQISMPESNEIWFLLQGDNIEISYSDIESFDGDMRLDVGMVESYKLTNNVLKLKYYDSIGSLSQYIPSKVGDYPILATKLPKLSHLGDSDMGNSVLDDFDVIMQDVDYIEENAINSNTVICLANTPPDISEWTFPGDTDIYVDDDLVNIYKAETNWDMYNIQPLSSLDNSVYNWG